MIPADVAGKLAACGGNATLAKPSCQRTRIDASAPPATRQIDDLGLLRTILDAVPQADSPDALRKSPLLLGVINVFAFWLIGVLGVGLARLARVPFLRAAWFVLAFWIIQESIVILLGGAVGLFGL